MLDGFIKIMEEEEKKYQERLKIYKRRKETGAKIKVKYIPYEIDSPRKLNN